MRCVFSLFIMTSKTKIAVDVALKAGKLLQKYFRSGKMIVNQKEDNSPVTDCDMMSHQLIIDHLTHAFPTHKILSEESPNALQNQIENHPTWIIDPLDGTSNFIAEIPLFAVVIAFVVKKETQIGIIYDPIHKELFIAEKGKGAKLNNRPIHVSTYNQTKGGMLFAGRGYKKRDRDRHGQIIFALEKETTYFRRLGCASIMLSSVAAGRADSVILTGNEPWDTLAGSLLIKEAGGKITNYCGKPWTIDSEDLLASNGLIHKKLLKITCPIDNCCKI